MRKPIPSDEDFGVNTLDPLAVGTAMDISSPGPALRLIREFIPILTRLAAAVVSFGALAIAGRALGPAEFGVLSTLLLGSRLVAAASTRGAGPQILAGLGASNLSGSMKQVLARSTSLALPLGAAIGASVSVAYDGSLVSSALLGGLGAASSASAAVVLLAGERLKHLGHANVAICGEFLPLSTVVAGLSLIFVSTESETAPLYVPALILTTAWIASATTQLVSLKRSRFRGLPLVERSSLKQSWIAASTAISASAPLMVVLAIAIASGPETAGVSNAVLRLVSPSMIVLAGAAAVAMPTIGSNLQRNPVEAKRVYRKYQFLVAALTVPYQLLLFAFPEALAAVFGAQFDASTSLRIIVAGQLINGITGLSLETAQVLPDGARVDVLGVLTSAVLASVLASWAVAADELSAENAIFGVFAIAISTRSLLAVFVVQRSLGHSVPVPR